MKTKLSEASCAEKIKLQHAVAIPHSFLSSPMKVPSSLALPLSEVLHVIKLQTASSDHVLSFFQINFTFVLFLVLQSSAFLFRISVKGSNCSLLFWTQNVTGPCAPKKSSRVLNMIVSGRPHLLSRSL